MLEKSVVINLVGAPFRNNDLIQILDLVIRQVQAISMVLFPFFGFCSGFMYVIANVGEFLEG